MKKLLLNYLITAVSLFMVILAFSYLKTIGVDGLYACIAVATTVPLVDLLVGIFRLSVKVK